MKFQSVKIFTASIIYDVFLFTLTAYLASLALEAVWSGVVVRWINFNILLSAVLISGVLAVFLEKDLDQKKGQPPTYWFGVSAVSLIAGWIVYQSSTNLDGWSIVFAAMVTCITFLAAYVLAGPIEGQNSDSKTQDV